MDLCVLFVLALKKMQIISCWVLLHRKKSAKFYWVFFVQEKLIFFGSMWKFFTEKNQYNFLRLWWGSSFASAIHVLFVCMCVADFSLVTYNHICENFFRLSFHAAFSIDCNQSLFCPTSDNKKVFSVCRGWDFFFFKNVQCDYKKRIKST